MMRVGTAQLRAEYGGRTALGDGAADEKLARCAWLQAETRPRVSGRVCIEAVVPSPRRMGADKE